MALNFNKSIDLGHILTAIAMIGTGVTLYAGMDKRITVIEVQMTYQQKMIDKMADATDRLANIQVALAENQKQMLANQALLIGNRGSGPPRNE